MDHIDVRGPHPVYVNGTVAITLTGAKRDITIEEARILVGVK